jgi:hypothetical protein
MAVPTFRPIPAGKFVWAEMPAGSHEVLTDLHP